MMKISPTPQLVKGLWKYLSDDNDSEVIHKPDSKLMPGVAWALETMGIMDAEKFLEDFATTIFETIYIPFEIGQETFNRWSLISQMATAIHEHEHVYQCQVHGPLVFAADYLAKRSSRAHYEAQAYRTNMEFRYWLTGGIDDPTYYAQKILNYGCGQDEVAYVRNYLEMSVPVIEQGAFISPITKLAIDWLEEQRKQGQA
jgi:hypothetical protein